MFRFCSLPQTRSSVANLYKLCFFKTKCILKPDKYVELGLRLSIIRAFHLDGGVPGFQEKKYWSFLLYLEFSTICYMCSTLICCLIVCLQSSYTEAYFILWLVIILGDMKALSRCVVPLGNANVYFQSVSDIKSSICTTKEL